MNTQKFKHKLYAILQKDNRLFDEESNLNQTLLFDLVDKIDEQIIDLLLGDKDTKEKFFSKIRDVYVFKTNDFKFFIDENKIFNSYTQYKNRIGLSDGKEFINDRREVVLNFPFKDCVLEGGQTTEEGEDTYFKYEDEKTKTVNKQKVIEPAGYKEYKTKRKEIFFNEVLAKDEIDRLFDPKALVNWKRYTQNGEDKVVEIKRDENGDIKENFIIKGNNLLALQSLKKEFYGKVKMIYIDPPYGKDADTFYNDSFKLSTWLTFMKNRLSSAKNLLAKDGIIFIQISYHNLAELKLIADEIFNSNPLNIISVKVRSASGFKVVNPGCFVSSEFILVYAKEKGATNLKKSYVESDYDDAYSKLVLNRDKSIEKWEIVSLKDEVAKSLGYINFREMKKKLGTRQSMNNVAEYALMNSEKICQLETIGNAAGKKSLQLKSISNNERGRVFETENSQGEKRYIYNGREMAFYNKKLRDFDGVMAPSTILTDIWTDISWEGIGSEGGVTLNRGKKPERLLKRIIEISTNPGDIVMDYHLGSGTTCAVAHKMGRQYIGIEQLDYGNNDSTVRLQNVINGDTTGISQDIEWKGGGDFIYLELAKWNEEAKEIINNSKTIQELIVFFEEMYEKYFLNYNVKVQEFRDKVVQEEEFLELSFDEQKRMFLTMLDLNQMYIPASEMEDAKYAILEEYQKLTKMFYGEVK